jgi:hypothetical protein
LLPTTAAATAAAAASARDVLSPPFSIMVPTTTTSKGKKEPLKCLSSFFYKSHSGKYTVDCPPVRKRMVRTALTQRARSAGYAQKITLSTQTHTHTNKYSTPTWKIQPHQLVLTLALAKEESIKMDCLISLLSDGVVSSRTRDDV